MENSVTIEYEDVDEHNNPINKLQSIPLSEAHSLIKKVEEDSTAGLSLGAGNQSACAERGNSSTNITFLELFNNSEAISKIISLA